MPTKKKSQAKATRSKAAASKSLGRPTKYTPKIADEIMHRIVQGESLNKILKDDHLPCMSTVFGWLTDKSKPDFLDKYNQAKELQAEFYANQLIDIADDSSDDYVEKTQVNGEVVMVANAEHIQRSRLRVDTRKWVASKLLPKGYGDRQELTVDADDQIKELMRLIRPTLGPPAYREK